MLSHGQPPRFFAHQCSASYSLSFARLFNIERLYIRKKGSVSFARRNGLLWALMSVCCLLHAQRTDNFSNLRHRVADASRSAQSLDSLTIIPPLLTATDSATGQIIGLQYFSIKNNLLLTDTARLKADFPDSKKIRVAFRVLPFNLGTTASRLDTSAIRRSGRPDAIEFDYSPYEPPGKPFETGNLSSNGAYTRGFSLGNSQNLVFNSNLNLQLNGKLGNDLEILAALSDNSIPLQPDGTTRQLQEFDRIFIQLKRKNVALTAGDYDLTRPTGYFSNYFKRLKGAMVEYKGIGNAGMRFGNTSAPTPSLNRLPASDTISLRGAVAVSGGKFARQTIQGQEGNQGPYRLRGAEGEQFIIVLAGTEKVFLDGQLLRRGLSDDYVVDYNLGEVTFTPRRLITKDSRLIVEFEYAVQTYLRSTVAANTGWNTRRGRYYFNLYSEQDARNNGAQELSTAERRGLALAGDNLRNAYAPGIDTLADFDPSRVLYRSVDSVVCGAPTAILVYSTNPDSARYAARFTEVLPGQGHYVLAPSSANGRVFRWSPPDPLTCQPTGNFEPVVRLIAPELRQMYAAGADFQPFKGGQLQAELALSNRDFNRFSPIGNNDNYGWAAFAGYRQTLFEKGSWNSRVYANYERTAQTFFPLNPYRPAEFVRDWNTDNSRDTVAEQIARGGFSLENKNTGGIRYEFGSFDRQSVYDGQRHFSQVRLQKHGYEFLGEINLLTTTGAIEKTRFSRPKFDLSKTFFKKDTAAQKAAVKIGLYGEREKNERRAAGADTLSRTSFWYDLYRLYFQTPDHQGAWQFGGFLSQRNDFSPKETFFKNNTIANEANLNGAWRSPQQHHPSTRQNINWTVTYRKLRIRDQELTTQEAQETYLGRIDYNLSAWKNALNLTSGYEIGSGQSPKVEFTYLAVNPGEGQYTWVDRNRDSILQVDEMEIAVFQDQANYVRLAVTSSEYIRTNNVLLSQNLRLEPRLVWGAQKRGWRKTLSRFSTQSTLQINRRTFAGMADISPWNPFQLDIADSALVTVTTSARNVLFVNRANPSWDVSIAQGSNRSQVALTTGYEQRRNADWTLHGRINLGKQWSTEADVTHSEKSSDNQAFDSRDFLIRGWEASPKVTWLPNRTFRIVLNLNLQSSRNMSGNAEQADQTHWNTELTWNPAGRANAQGFRAATSLRAKGTFADIRFGGEPNTAVAFAMLEGLQDGKNFLWSLNLDRQLSRIIQMSVSYEGRKTGTNRVVHVARAQVRAVF
ncbi:MAG: hypothetical protein EPGJADBJ_00608 [Saprospiraceae bacterium]|nr:hypothetical protein [Saprospiraceae bacterium]